MSLYNFAPCSTLSQQHPFVSWDNAFTDEQLYQLVEYLDSLEKQEAVVDGDNPDGSVRKSSVAWVQNQNEISAMLYDTLAFVARKLNAQFYGFDLYGFVEHMQYTVYDGSEEGHYTWHLDMSDNSPAARKLSLVLQLSDPDEYEGGVLQTMIASGETSVDKKRGLIAAFPSWTLHRVTPVTKGIRKTLVVWVAGPQFK
jgi:PKHD-type hydroxylase